MSGSGENAHAPKRIIIGICALDSKVRSKPMRNILNRLIDSNQFEAIIFGDKVILDEEIQNWPTCDFLISFFSQGFPLRKALDYVKLRGPFCVNSLSYQELLLDRRLVLAILDAIGVPTPRRLISQRDDVPDILPEVIDEVMQTLKIDISPAALLSNRQEVVQIDADTIRVGEELMKKPFVEKPVAGEDHNINIYYPLSMGGGVRRLFRKVGNKSSEFTANVTSIRSDGGSYIYEEFMNVDNAEDVKVYTIGESFAHAETRKSPVVDGIVRRNAEGKEVRYITPLTDFEKDIAAKVTRSFEQTVCGFDLLRANGKSYVIDVNGWSFVKGNDDYYTNCSQILRNLFLKEIGKRRAIISHGIAKQPSSSQHQIVERPWKLKAFLSVLRHGDRTPKQKMKFSFKSTPFLDLLAGKTEEVIFKTAEEIDLVGKASRIAREIGCEDIRVLDQLDAIMAEKGSMIGTKIQIKPSLKIITEEQDSKEVATSSPSSPSNNSTSTNPTSNLVPRISSTRKELVKIQVILKWGGEFTHSGYYHSKDLGENLRKDLLLINKELLNDVRIYSSPERRVLATAEIFYKSLLNVTDLPENVLILSKDMLDDSNAAKEQMEFVKRKLQVLLSTNSSTSKVGSPTSDPFSESKASAPSQLTSSPSLAATVSPLSIPVVAPTSGGAPAAGTSYQAYSSIMKSPTSTISTSGVSSVDLNALPSPTNNNNNVNVFANNEFTADLMSPLVLSSSSSSLENLPTGIIDPELLFSWGAGDVHPSTWVEELIDLLAAIRIALRKNFKSMDVDKIQSRWCCSESPFLFKERWEKLCRDFCDVKRSAFEPSKISELYDSVKYDLLHNRKFAETVFSSPSVPKEQHYFRQLYNKSKVLFDFISPKEYGIEDGEKLEIGMLSAHTLLKQLVSDLLDARESNSPSTRLYFTKESKVICLLNIVLLSGLPTKLFFTGSASGNNGGGSTANTPLPENGASTPNLIPNLSGINGAKDVDELDYLTQITFELYERSSSSVGEDGSIRPSSSVTSTADGDQQESKREYSLRISFSPGAHNSNLIDLHLDSKHSLSVAPRRWISDHINLEAALLFLSPKIN